MNYFWSLFLVLFSFGVRGQDSELLSVHVFHRHGSKLPDIIDPLNAQVWEPFLPRNPGDVSPLGETEFRTLGRLLRERYIEEEGFLADEYDQNEIYIRASTFNPRPLQSTESLVRTLYPGAPVIIYTVDPLQDTLLVSGWSCPSWTAEVKLRHDKFAQDVLFTKYIDWVSNITAFTGYAGVIFPDIIDFVTPCTIEECPAMFGWLSADGIDQYIKHGFGDTLNPYFVENHQTVYDVSTDFEAAGWSMMGNDDDPRGPGYGELAREVIQNLLDAIDGSSARKLINYSIHSVMMVQLLDAFGLPVRWPSTGEGIILELRRNSGGEYVVRAEYFTPNFGGESFNFRVQPLRCPTLQGQCSLEPFLEFLGERNALKPSDGGCCLRGEAFYEIGCGDYLNPAVLEIPECRIWRTFCPQTSCGDNQIVDRATLLCVQLG